MPATAEMTSRLEVDIQAEIWNTIQKAAEMKGLSPGDFVTKVAHREARGILEGDGPIWLNREESERLLELLENPPEPNAAML